MRSPYSEGAAGLIQKLQRLTTTASAMHTGAHPDDEDSALLARLARGDHARVAYLSLNRGEGGQNVLGPEFYEALGVIRTEELLQARALDGGEQFFTRVVDFGYTVNMPETERKWGGRDVPLADMVRVIRMYRPLVVASRFSGTAADGHGNHQLAGALTPLAVKAAADPTQFPEQLDARACDRGRSASCTSACASVRTSPTRRRSRCRPVSWIPRSADRTRRSRPRAARSTRRRRWAARCCTARSRRDCGWSRASCRASSKEQSVFDGIDTSIPGLAALAGLPAGSLAAQLATMDAAAREALDERRRARAGADPADTGARPDGGARRRTAVAAVAASADARADATFLLDQEIRQYEDAMLHASGVHVEALATAETIVPGGQASVSVRAFVPEGGDRHRRRTLARPATGLVADATRRGATVRRPRVHGALPARTADAAGVVCGDGCRRCASDAAVLARARARRAAHRHRPRAWRRLRVEGRTVPRTCHSRRRSRPAVRN